MGDGYGGNRDGVEREHCLGAVRGLGGDDPTTRRRRRRTFAVPCTVLLFMMDRKALYTAASLETRGRTYSFALIGVLRPSKGREFCLDPIPRTQQSFKGGEDCKDTASTGLRGRYGSFCFSLR